MEIEIDADEIAASLDELRSQVDSQVKQAFNNALEMIAATAKHLAPKGATSLLSNSIQVGEVTGSFWDWNLEGTVEATAPYALAVEEGTRPHEIRPKYRRALRIPIEGGYLFRKAVQHPGTAPQPFMQPALEQNQVDAMEEIGAAIELAMRRAGF